MAVALRISVKDWDLKESQKKPNPQVFKHLDLGSANYGPADQKPGVPDSKIYRVLYSNVDRIISEHAGYKKFTLYLNDISSEGLNKAADSLVKHLEQTYQDRDIKIKIVKIAKDFFDFDPIPSIDSASLLNPDGHDFFGRSVILSGEDLQWTKNSEWKNSNSINEIEKIVHFFQRVASASKEGFLVREINMRRNIADKISKRLSSPEGMTLYGLHFVDAKEKTKSIESYISPRGIDFFVMNSDRGSVSYLVTQHSTEPCDSSILALQAELQKARQECDGYETEGHSASIAGNPNLVLIRNPSGKEEQVEGKLIGTNRVLVWGTWQKRQTAASRAVLAASHAERDVLYAACRNAYEKHRAAEERVKILVNQQAEGFGKF